MNRDNGYLLFDPPKNECYKGNTDEIHKKSIE